MYDQQTSTPDQFPEQTEARSPSQEEVRAQLGRMLQCRLFRHSPRLSRFFVFTVEQALAGAEQRLKEYSIALEVFGKPETFDPRMDSAVRVAARQLRAKIDLYYLTEGAQDPVLIRYRPGDYIPKFYSRTDAPALGGAEGEQEAVTRPVIIVEKDRAGIRTLTDCLDTLNTPIVSVLDSGERCLEMLPRVGPATVITGLNLIGSMTGTALARALRSETDAAVIALVPASVDSQLLEELLAADPDALLYEPVRTPDVRIALKIAARRRAQHERQRSEQAAPEYASVA
jgi:CheY-like chemotaxis protein